jgi:hypothetical protein
VLMYEYKKSGEIRNYDFNVFRLTCQ